LAPFTDEENLLMTELTAPSETRRPVILCVDDEPSILSALRRLFRAHGFVVLAAESGQAGLDILDKESIDLVISDMRMPQMDGVVFLEHVRLRKPDIPRLLLSGYADIASITGAINRGEIYRYIAKPWDDNDIILTVKDALEHSVLVKEKRRLEALVIAQAEPTIVAAGLESREDETIGALRQANDNLRNSFLTSLKMFSALVELRDKKLAGHSRRVADMSRRLAQAMHLDKQATQDVFVAALLHTIGMVGFEEELLHTPTASMNPTQLETFLKHPLRAEQLLMPLSELQHAVEIIVAQLERYDGSGYPRGTAGENIPFGARLLAITSDFDRLQMGAMEPGPMSPLQAREIIRQRRTLHYDPAIVDVFLDITEHASEDALAADAAPTRVLKSHELAQGLVLASDLTAPAGLLILAAGQVLDDTVIQKICSFERLFNIPLVASVWVGNPPTEV